MTHETDVKLQIVLKVASRCNLNCSYCYVYNKGDDSWRMRPPLMSDAVFRAAVERMKQHCERSKQRTLYVTFHGGEPCLVGPRQFDQWCGHARSVLKNTVRLKLCLQTNGTLLDCAWAEVLAKHNVGVGVSLDGPKPEHDHFRVDHEGRGSYDHVVRGLEHLRSVGIPLQILSVIQFGADGVRIHRHFVELGAKVINYLFPDFTHDTIKAVYDAHGPTPCADFLIPIFDEWWDHGTIDLKVSLFWNIARLILGGDTELDLLGNHPLPFLFVETDGRIELLDVLRACGRDITSTGLNVLNDQFESVANLSLFHRKVVFTGVPLPSACQACPERYTCAGGYLPHRYSRQREFDNPTVWCADILRLFAHIRERLGVSANETAIRHSTLRALAAQHFSAAAGTHTEAGA